MFYGSGNLFFCTFLAVVIPTAYSDPDSITGSGPQFSVFRFKTKKPGEILQDYHAEKMAANLEELITVLDYKEKFPVKKLLSNFEEKMEKIPYYASATAPEDHCLINNGNCSQICENVGLQTVCSCREGYTLSGDTDCIPVSGCNTILSGTSGEFTMDDINCQWTIQAPTNQIIKITLHSTRHYEYYYYVEESNIIGAVYDGNSSEANIIKYIYPRQNEMVLTSTGRNVLIKSYSGWNYNSYPQHVSYVTGFPFLEINADVATGLIRVFPLSEGDDCFSVTRTTPQGGYLLVTLLKSYDRDEPQTLTPELSFEGNDGKWKRDIFLLPTRGSNKKWEKDYNENQFDQGTTELTFEFFGKSSKVYNLRKCLNVEYHALGGKQSFGAGTVCRNGGSWSNETQTCTCPQGFVGVHCEEGCGPNRYGENCSKLCSFLPSACEGILFCTNESCSCAPGLQGTHCDLPCDSGNYGASCQQQCGKCKDSEPCDRYTGMCYSGCSAGYYPPLCQQTYKVLMSAPHVIGVTYESVKIGISFENVTGEGEPVFYEVQYKEVEQTSWSKMSPRKIPSKREFDVVENFEIVGLLAGTVYETRVILIDKDGGHCESDVPISKALTKCIDPHKGDYTFSAKGINETGILLEWSYEHDKTSVVCDIAAFELTVHCGSEQIKFITTDKKGSKQLSNILPDMSYNLQLIGKTVTGQNTPPIKIEVHTPAAVPGRVRAVKALPLASGRQLNVTWLPPWDSQDKPLRYRVTYQCISLLACDSITCDTLSGYTKVSTTSALLGHLQPHALYRIAVASVSPSGVSSESYVIEALTADTAPHAAPSAAQTPVPAATNTSVSISWRPPLDCSALNGYIYGYSYSLIDNSTAEVIQQGTVPENILSVNFSGLSPSHCYGAHITVVSSGGTSLSDELKIPFCTTSTAPEPVQSLSVYKRGRRMVGLRWSPPLNAYGDIESFTITYGREGSDHSRKLVAEPKRCGAWIRLYCYTVTGLSPGKKYHFKVQARNKEVSIDGEPAAVEAITSEGVSTPPVNLTVINATENSMVVEWGMPDNVNGQLRSFIIIVEQIDTQADSVECCDEIPLQDYRVVSEEPFYRYEITGLSAASTYSVTVSAKTVTLGEESRIIGHTHPPKASLPKNALVIVNTDSSSYRPDGVTLEIHPAERISGVNRKYILLYLTNDSATQQPLDDELSASLQSIFTENYHLLSEYTQEEIENQSLVTVHLKELGFVSKEIQSQKYALVLLQDYMGNRSMDILIAEDTGDEVED